MIITDETQGWTEKVNFTDKNDVFVGYDMGQCCCEEAGYFFSYQEDTLSSDDNEANEDLEGYVFDTSFFKEVNANDLDEGGQVCFKLVCEGKSDLFLHLYNCHNGYYGHGFEAEIKGLPWKDGCL